MNRNEAYKTAEEKIREAFVKRETSLELSGMGLTQIPECISDLVWLQHLHANENQLTSLPESLGQLRQLETVSVHGNQLSSLPDSLGQLANLRSLFLFGNQLISLPQSFVRLTRLKHLYLGSNQFAELPPAINALGKLQALSIWGNKLKTIPRFVAELTQLLTLNISANPLTELPDFVAQLTQLQELGLWGLQLRVLPTWLDQLRQLKELNVAVNELAELPEWMGDLLELEELVINTNQLGTLPDWMVQYKRLRYLDVSHNQLNLLPEWIGRLANLQKLRVSNNQLATLPDWIGQLRQLQELDVSNNQLNTLPESLASLSSMNTLNVQGNPLNPEIIAAADIGLSAIIRYLNARADAQLLLNEAKLILVGEGEVGKSCLLAALRGDPWVEDRPTTHGIEIKALNVTDKNTGVNVTLNGWDFGGQRVYRPTHQLFFSAPAIYLVVWKPREGSQQGSVKEWIKLIKHREPDAKILVVATHGGPGQRQPDIDKQEIWDLFGRDTVIDFFLVDSKPDGQGDLPGLAALKDAVAQVAIKLPEMGRRVPTRWQRAREALKTTGAPYLSLTAVLEICSDCGLNGEEAQDFLTISHRLGHIIHYEHDRELQHVIVLKPDWLAAAISLVLDDKATRDAHGLVSFARLRQLWNDPQRGEELRYSDDLHPVFLRLMERFDISYRIAEASNPDRPCNASLIAQLVPDVRPDLALQWPLDIANGDQQQVQICHIVEQKTGHPASAEGLFYQLIVRLHRYSLGRTNYSDSVHWQRGLVLDDDYNGRGLMEHVGNDVRISVRAPYPERFLSVLTSEVKWLVETYWGGLRCEIMVPCVDPCGKQASGTGLFEVQKLIAFKRQGMMLFPCIVSGCNQAQDIDGLLRNATIDRATSVQRLISQEFQEMRKRLNLLRDQLIEDAEKRFELLDMNDRRLLSRIEDAFATFMQTLTDEAKEGPRLFSFHPIEPGFFDKPKWIGEKFRLTLWCEHSRLPLPALNGEDDTSGVYDLNIPRQWFVKAAPFFKILASTLSLVLPVASATTKLLLDEKSFKRAENELDMSEKTIDSAIKGAEKAADWAVQGEALGLEKGEAIRADGAALRELHTWLREKDPGFGGLVRVQNKRHEFLWVHKKFEHEY